MITKFRLDSALQSASRKLGSGQAIPAGTGVRSPRANGLGELQKGIARSWFYGLGFRPIAVRAQGHGTRDRSPAE